MNLVFFVFFDVLSGQAPHSGALEGLLRGDLVYVECKIDQMCAYMSESWLESEGIYESDTPYLTLADRAWFLGVLINP